MRLPLVALAIVLGALCLIATVSAIAHQSAFSEYLTQARRCVELNDCPSRGGRTGGLPIFHGAVWIRLLAYSLRAGGDQTPVQSIILGLMMLSVLLTFFLLHRYLGFRAAALALGLYFPVVLVPTDITFFTYTNLLPLPFAVYYAGVCLFVERQRAVFAAVASLALAAAVSAEMGNIVMVPFHLLLVSLTARRRLFTTAVACLSFAVPFGWESTDAALQIVRQIPTVRFAVGLAISAGIAALGARLGPTVLPPPSVSAPDRVRAIMTAALIYATATIWLGNLLLSHGVPAPRYFLPASLPFLYLVAEQLGALAMRPTILVGTLAGLSLLLLSFATHGLAVLQVPVVIVVTAYTSGAIVRLMRSAGSGPSPGRSLWPTVMICLCAMAVAVGDIILIYKRGAVQALTLADAEQLVSRLYAAGYTYPELLGSLQGPAADDLMPLLTERDPHRFTQPSHHLVDADFSLLVAKVPHTSISTAHGVVAAVPVDDSRSAIVVRSERTYLDWIGMRRCTWTSDEAPATSYRCTGPRMDRPLPYNWPYVEFADAAPLSAARPPDQANDWSVRYEVPVRTPGRRDPHIVHLTNEWPATWRIVRVSGVEFEGELPGVEIRLPDTRAAAGVVELEFIAAVPVDLPWVWLPHGIEVTQDNEHLLEPLRSPR